MLFINESVCLSQEQKTLLLAEWKSTSGAKLKTQMHKSVVKTPKRVVSKYLYFCEEERPKILAENKGMGIHECTCILGKRWRDFQENPDPVRMARYVEKFEADKKRYDEEKKACEGEISCVPEKAKKPHKLTPFLRYCAERRKHEPKILLKELGGSWAKIKANPEEFARYVDVQ